MRFKSSVKIVLSETWLKWSRFLGKYHLDLTDLEVLFLTLLWLGTK